MLRRTAEYAGTRRHAGRTPDSVVERFLFVKANCAVGFARIPQLLENKVSGLSLTWPVERQVSAQERFDVEIGWLNALGDRLDYRSARNARGRKRPTYSCAGSRVWRSRPRTSDRLSAISRLQGASKPCRNRRRRALGKSKHDPLGLSGRTRQLAMRSPWTSRC